MSEWIKHDGNDCPRDLNPGDRIDYKIKKDNIIRTDFVRQISSWRFSSCDEYLIYEYRLSDKQYNEAWTNFEVLCRCPRCNHKIDLIDDDDGLILEYAFENSNEDLDINVTCDNCNNEFMINYIWHYHEI